MSHRVQYGEVIKNLMLLETDYVDFELTLAILFHAMLELHVFVTNNGAFVHVYT